MLAKKCHESRSIRRLQYLHLTLFGITWCLYYLQEIRRVDKKDREKEKNSTYHRLIMKISSIKLLLMKFYKVRIGILLRLPLFCHNNEFGNSFYRRFCHSADESKLTSCKWWRKVPAKTTA